MNHHKILKFFVEQDNWVWTGSSNHIQVKENRLLKLDYTHLGFKLKAHSFVVSNLCLETKVLGFSLVLALCRG